MAILHRHDERYPAEPTQCFLCGEDLDDGSPAVYWSGAGGGDLYLHGGCAGSFVLRLARDAWELERDAGDGKVTLLLREPGWRTA